MTIEGISHLTFIVKDLELASKFFITIFDAQEVYSSGEKQFSLSREKFFLIGDIWVCTMQGEPLSEQAYNHCAFKISEEHFPLYLYRIKSLGLTIRPERLRVDGEGHSVYFYDFDNHLFELYTGTLDERLENYSKRLSPY